MNSEEVRDRIRKARLAMNYSQETLASLVGLSTNSYGAIESGKTRLFHPKLERIANVLNISVEELFFDKREAIEQIEQGAIELKRVSNQLRTLQEEFAHSTYHYSAENEQLKTKVKQLNHLIESIRREKE